MVRQCFVCKKLDYLNINVSFHRIPVNMAIRKTWFSIMGLPFDAVKTAPKHPSICSDHFLEEDFEYYGVSKRKFLKKGAVPKIEKSQVTPPNRAIKYIKTKAKLGKKSTNSKLCRKVPTKHSTVCSCHFENADRKNLPTIFNRKRQCRLRCKPLSTPRSKPLIRKKVSEEKSGKQGSSTESASETEEMEALIEGCTNNTNNIKHKVKKITFHGFAKSMELQTKWINILNNLKSYNSSKRNKKTLRVGNVSSTVKICSEHFTTEDFVYQSPFKRSLKSCAIPSKFNFRESLSLTDATLDQHAAATKAINQPERRVHCSTSSASKSEDIEDSIYREHSYSLWKNTKVEKEKNMQFEFVNCMSETKYLDESDNILSSSQNVPVKEEIVQSNTSNVIYGNVENEERINMRDVYLSHVKKEVEDDTDFSDIKVKEEEIFIKDEIIEEESESSPSTAYHLVLQTVPMLEIYYPEHVS